MTILENVLQPPVADDEQGQGGNPPLEESAAIEPESVPAETPSTPEPVTPEPEEPISVPSLPGEVTSEAETAWLRQTVADLAARLQEAQRAQAEWESVNLTEEDRQARAMAAQERQLRQQYENLQAEQARTQWRSYYESWVPKELIVGDDPIKWQHNALTHLFTEAQKLRRENAALKKVAAKPAPTAPKITSPSPSASYRKPIGQITLADLERIKDAALWGNISQEDYPVIE